MKPVEPKNLMAGVGRRNSWERDRALAHFSEQLL